MLEKLKESGKLPIIIGIVATVFAIIIIAIAVTIGININNSKEANYNLNISDQEQNNQEDDEPIIIIDQEQEEKTEEPQEEQEQQPEQEIPKVDSKYFIRVNYGANVVTIYTKDANGEYTKPYKAMVCSTGKATPRSGTYTIPATSGTSIARAKWGYMVGNVWAQYFTRIVGSILFHSVPYTAQNKWSLEYWEYDKLGTAASAGCIRLTVENAKWIYDNCPAGTKVEFYSDTNPGPLVPKQPDKISEHEAVRNWDPTDPDPNNPWKTYTPPQKEEVPENNTPEITPTPPVIPGENDTTEEENTKPEQDNTTEGGTTKPEQGDTTEGGTIKPEQGDTTEGGTTKPEQDNTTEGGTAKPEEDDATNGDNATGEGTTIPDDDNTTDEGEITPEDNNTTSKDDKTEGETTTHKNDTSGETEVI